MALERLRIARSTLEARIQRILVAKRDRDREIVELHGARKHMSGSVSARLRRLLARRHMCDRSAHRFEEMLAVVDQQILQLEDWASIEQTVSALRGGAAAGAEQQRLIGGMEAVDSLLEELERQRDTQANIQGSLDEYNKFESMPDAEAEEELQRLIEEEHIADQFAVIAAAPQVPEDDPMLRATMERAQTDYLTAHDIVFPA